MPCRNLFEVAESYYPLRFVSTPVATKTCTGDGMGVRDAASAWWRPSARPLAHTDVYAPCGGQADHSLHGWRRNRRRPPRRLCRTAARLGATAGDVVVIDSLSSHDL